MPNIIEITDFEASELDIYARTTENQLLNRHEPDKGVFIAESPLVIERALDAGCNPISILVEKKHIENQAKPIIERCGDIPVYTAEFDLLTKLTGFKLTRGMLCAMYRPKLEDVRTICKDARRITVLENVVNPTNVGAIFRSAAAMGIDAVILTQGCSNPLYRRAIRVSMGTVFQIPWTFIDNDLSWPEQGISLFHEMGFKLTAMALSDDSIRIDDKSLMNEEKLAIVLGTEGDGLMDETISGCDYTVRIPMSHGVDSLNVAACQCSRILAAWYSRLALSQYIVFHSSSYLISTSFRPFAGAVGPALLLSAEDIISDISSAFFIPRPTSISVPAMIRTILYRKPLPCTIIRTSLPERSFSSVTVRLYIVLTVVLTCAPAEQKAAKSCSPIKALHASFIASISRFP